MNHAPVMSTKGAVSASGGPVIDCKIDKLHYGDFLAVRDSHVPVAKGKITNEPVAQAVGAEYHPPFKLL